MCVSSFHIFFEKKIFVGINAHISNQTHTEREIEKKEKKYHLDYSPRGLPSAISVLTPDRIKRKKKYFT